MRSYGFVAYGVSGISYPGAYWSAPGLAYRAELTAKYQALADSVSRHSPAGLAHSCNIPRILYDMLAVC